MRERCHAMLDIAREDEVRFLFQLMYHYLGYERVSGILDSQPQREVNNYVGLPLENQ